jgi:hypothetical protein
MATSVQSIITDALLDLGILAAGEAPVAADVATCLDSLRQLLQGLPGYGIGGQLTPVVVSTSPYLAKPNERVIWAGSGSLVLNLPSLVDGVPPRNGDRVETSNANQDGRWFYLASAASWVNVDELTLVQDCPLGEAFVDDLVSMLAAKVARRFGVALTADLVQASERGRDRIAAAFAPDMSGTIDPALWSYWSTWPGARA